MYQYAHKANLHGVSHQRLRELVYIHLQMRNHLRTENVARFDFDNTILFSFF